MTDRKPIRGISTLAVLVGLAFFLSAIGDHAAAGQGKDAKPAPRPKKPSPALKNQKRVGNERPTPLWRNGEITDKDPVHPDGKRYKVYPYEMKAGMRYAIDLVHRGVNIEPEVQVQDETGKPLVPLSRSRSGAGSVQQVYHVNRDGTYKVMAGGSQTGGFTLRVQPVMPGERWPQRLQPPSPPPGAPAVRPITLEQTSDIVITPFPAPATNMGGSSDQLHGYEELRFLIENRSTTDDHRITLTFPRFRPGGGYRGHYLRSISRSVMVPAGSKVNVSLWVPDLQLVGDGVEVAVNGTVDGRSLPVRLDNQGGRRGRIFRGGGGSGHFQANILTAPELFSELQSNVFKSAVGPPPKILKQKGWRMTGELTATDPFYRSRAGRRHKSHRLKLEAGKRYLIDLIDDNKGASIDPYLYVEDATGRLLAHNDDGGGNLNSRLIFQPPVTDNYRIIATTFSAGRTGKYVLTVQPVEAGMAVRLRSSAYGTTSGTYNGQSYTYARVHRFHAAADAVESWTDNWLGYSRYDGVVVPGDQLATAPADVQEALWKYVECGGSLLIVGPSDVPESWQRRKSENEEFTEYYPGFGRCLVIEQSFIPQCEPEHWRPIAAMWEEAATPWYAPRTPTSANQTFPIVEDLSIPVRGLFAVMLLFTVLIGPVNVYVLSRKKRRIWMLWTVPAFSLVTCLAVFGFMVVSEGWSGHVRTEGITFLDETSKRASSIGWMGIYAPMTPGDGLRFGYDTEVSPHFDNDYSGRRYRGRGNALSIDWSDGQHLDTGWVQARLPTHLSLRTSEQRVERLLVRRQKDGNLYAVNALEAPIRELYVADAEGKIYSGKDIRAGGEIVLEPTEQTVSATENVDALHQVFAAHWISKLDELIAQPESCLAPGCYLAVLDGTPFFEEGLQGADRRGRSLVYGILKGGAPVGGGSEDAEVNDE